MWSLKRLSVSDVSSGLVVERTTSPSRQPPRHYRKNHRWPDGAEWSEETRFGFWEADALLPLAPRRCTTSSSASSPIVCCSVAV